MMLEKIALKLSPMEEKNLQHLEEAFALCPENKSIIVMGPKRLMGSEEAAVSYASELAAEAQYHFNLGYSVRYCHRYGFTIFRREMMTPLIALPHLRKDTEAEGYYFF